MEKNAPSSTSYIAQHHMLSLSLVYGFIYFIFGFVYKE